MKKNRIQSFIFSFIAVGLVLYNASGTFFGSYPFENKNGKVYVETIDDSRSLIHSKDSTDVLFEKRQNGGSYCYSLTDCGTGKCLGSFDSVQNIIMDNSLVQKPKLCAAAGSIVWAAMTGGNVLAALGALLTSVGGAASNGTIVAAVTLAIEEGGWAAVPAVIGILSGVEALVIAVGFGAIA